MAGEEWARRIIEKELKRLVTINDDNSAPSMYDLRIGPTDAPEIAIECTGAVNPVFTETWNIGPARGPIKLSITGDWIVKVAPGSRIRVIKQCLESLLQDLENQRIETVRVDHWLKRSNRDLYDKLESLGITQAICFRFQGSGTVLQFILGCLELVA